MSDNTGIEWATASWNPIAGCRRVSRGCEHCYAERMAARLQAMGVRGYEGVVNEGGRWTGRVGVIPALLEQPLKWRRSRRIFVNSMSDLFHEDVPFLFADRVFSIMAVAAQHKFVVLTKRPERMCSYMQDRDWGDEYNRLKGGEYALAGEIVTPLPNVALGVSVEDQATADERIPLLLQTPATCRVVSYEPALGPVDFDAIRKSSATISDDMFFATLSGKFGYSGAMIHNINRIDWIICGGESGPGARYMNPEWAISARDQCEAAKVPFFFKQMARREPIPTFLQIRQIPAAMRLPGEEGTLAKV